MQRNETLARDKEACQTTKDITLSLSMSVPKREALRVPANQELRVHALVLLIDTLLENSSAKDVKLERTNDNYKIDDDMPPFQTKYYWTASYHDECRAKRVGAIAYEQFAAHASDEKLLAPVLDALSHSVWCDEEVYQGDGTWLQFPLDENKPEEQANVST